MCRTSCLIFPPIFVFSPSKTDRRGQQSVDDKFFRKWNVLQGMAGSSQNHFHAGAGVDFARLITYSGYELTSTWIVCFEICHDHTICVRLATKNLEKNPDANKNECPK